MSNREGIKSKEEILRGLGFDLNGSKFHYAQVVQAMQAYHDQFTPQEQGKGTNEEIRQLTKERDYWKKRAEVGEEILQELCQLKSYKDSVGKDSVYQRQQPILWKQANDHLNNISMALPGESINDKA